MKITFIFFLLLSSLSVSAQNSVENKAIKPAPTKKIKKVVTETGAFTIGADARYYHYAEPEVDVNHSGLLIGVFGEWNWTSQIVDGKTYGNFLFGQLDYSGSVCEASNPSNCQVDKGRTNDLITKLATRAEIDLGQIKPFAGVGYRFLYDRGLGSAFYTRMGQAFFMPLGVQFSTQTSIGKLFAEIEYDYIFKATIETRLSDVSSTFPNLSHEQKGYGLFAQAGLNYSSSNTISAYYELWTYERSQDFTENIGGSPLTFYEPENKSESIGVRWGFVF